MIKLIRFIGALVLAMATGIAAAQGYPTKPVRMIVPFPPGSTPDTVARLVSQKLSEMWGQPIVVENRSGAGGNIGTDQIAKAAPDGYTLGVSINGPVAVNKALYGSLPYDPDADLAPISLLVSGPQILAVHPSIPANNLKEFVAYVKARPGKLSYGSPGSGSAGHLTMELLKTQAGLYLVHIPYRGFPPAVTDLVSNEIQALFAIVPAVLPQIKAGRLKGLAVTSGKRSATAPELATVAEQGFPQFDATAWIGMLAPGKTPPEIVNKISSDVQRVLSMPDVREKLVAQGYDVAGTTPQAFSRFIKNETQKWAKVIKTTGATPD